MKNLNLLKRFTPSYIEKIKNSDDSSLEFCKTDLGEHNLKFKGKEEYIHLQSGALREAEKWFKELFFIEGAQTLFIYGLGLGWYYFAAKKWLKRKKKRLLVFLEDDFAVIRKFLTIDQAKEILNDPQVVLLPFEISTSLIKSILFYVESPHVLSALKFYEEKKGIIKSRIGNYINFEEKHINAEFAWYDYEYEKKYLFNLYQNLFLYNDVRLGHNLFNRFNDIPIIICGAGPSLKKELPLLKTLQNKAIIFASGNAINILSKNGIIPHFAADVDPSRFTKVFRSLAYEAPFFFAGLIFHDLLKVIHADKLLINIQTSYPLEKSLIEDLRLKIGKQLFFEMSTTSFCSGISCAMGSKKIIFIGVDLAYKELKKYTKEVVSNPIDEDKIENTVQNSQELIKAKNENGQSIFTTKSWRLEANHFAVEAGKKRSVSFYNASHGLRIDNFISSDLPTIATSELTGQFDLLNLVHTEIQLSKYVNISEKNILVVFKTCEKNFIRARAALEALDVEYLKLLKSTRNSKIENMIRRLRRLKAYKTYLSRESAYYIYKNNRDYFMLKFWSDKMGKKELREKQVLFERKRINFLISRIDLHISLLKKASIRAKSSANEQLPVTYKLPKDKKFRGKAGKKKVGYYPNGAIKSICHYKKGVLHGSSTFYAKNGQKLAACHFVNGKRQGQNWQYYLSGKLYSLQNFKDDAQDGEQIYFYENGRIKTKMNCKKGKLHRRVLLYYSNGQFKRDIAFKNGKQNGLEKMWSDDGALLLKSKYRNNQPVGVAESFYPGGEKKKRVLYFDHADHFDFTFWSKDGPVIEKKVYFPEEIAEEFIKISKKTRDSIDTLTKKLKKYE